MRTFYRTKHREMWKWVAARLAGHNPERADKKLWPGWRKTEPNPQHCFACLAAAGDCEYCPVQWESVRGLPVFGCQTRAPDWRDRSLFEHYQSELANIRAIPGGRPKRKYGKDLSLTAARIAELPISETFAILWREGQVRII